MNPMRKLLPNLPGKGKTFLRWMPLVGALVLSSVLYGCKSNDPDEPKPGQIVTSDGKPAPPEAYNAMKAGNAGPQTGAKGKAARGGPPD